MIGSYWFSLYFFFIFLRVDIKFIKILEIIDILVICSVLGFGYFIYYIILKF